MSQSRFERNTRACGLVALVEAIALIVYCVFLSIAAFNSQGATVSAPIVEITIYVIFAIGIYLISRGLFAGSVFARAPYFLTQVFVLIIAFTLFVGDGAIVKTVGVVVGVLGLLGLAFGVAMIISDEPELPEIVETDVDEQDLTEN